MDITKYKMQSQVGYKKGSYLDEQGVQQLLEILSREGVVVELKQQQEIVDKKNSDNPAQTMTVKIYFPNE